MIHAIGDSNSAFFTGTDLVRGVPWRKLKPDDRIAEYRSYNIGPATAYQFRDKHLDSVMETINEAQIPAGDPILLVFGEIDCRWHVGKQSLETETHVWHVIDAAMKRYFEGVIKLRKVHNVIMWGVPPPNPEAREDHDGFIFGNNAFRFNITRMWNQALMERCEYCKIPYASIFWDLATNGYSTNPGFHLDNIHLNQKAMPAARNELYHWEGK